jgi:hypothetical protein
VNPQGKGGFGDHKENINRKGTKMRDFAMFRAAAIEIANEQVEVKVGDKKEKMPVYRAILRSWAQSKDARLQMAFIQYAVGSVPTVINGDQEGGPIKAVIQYANTPYPSSNVPPGASEDIQEPKEV